MTEKRNKDRNVPTLRFPGFTRDWESKKIGDIGDVKMCKRIFNEQTSPEGEIPFYKIGSFGRKADAFISRELYLDFKKRFSFPKKGEILISAAGTIGRTVIYDGEDAYYQDSNIVWIDNDESIVTNSFLYYILQIVKFNTEGGTIQRLYNNILRSTKFKCPEISEQKKISEVLEKIDARIQTQNKIIEELKLLKSTLCNLLFRMKIRFRDEKGKSFSDWDNITMGDILIEVNDKSTRNNQFKILSSTAKGLFNQNEYFNREIARKDNIGYKILNRNQLVFSPQNLWMGNINVNIDFENGIVSPSYKIFAFKPNTTAMYCQYYLKQPELLFEYEQASVQGASIVRRNLEMDKFLQIEITLPSVEEQNRIAKIISSIEQKMTLEIDFCQLLTNQKNYLLKHLLK